MKENNGYSGLITQSKKIESNRKRSSVYASQANHLTTNQLNHENYEKNQVTKRCQEIYNLLLEESSKHGILPAQLNIDDKALNESTLETVQKIQGLISLFCKKFDQQKELIKTHNMLDDYVTVSNSQLKELSDLKERNSVLNKKVSLLQEELKKPPSEYDLKKKQLAEDKEIMMKELCIDQESKKKEYEEVRDDYHR